MYSHNKVLQLKIKVISDENYPWFKIPELQKALDVLDLETLGSRREYLSLTFAQKCAANEKTEHMFPLDSKLHDMETRKAKKFKVQKANTDSLKFVAIIYMQNMLNEQE